MSTTWYHVQRYICCCCCKPKSLLQHPVTGRDDDWGLNYDEKTKNVRLSRELEKKPGDIETVPEIPIDGKESGSGLTHSPSNKERAGSFEENIPGEPKLMKASSADLTPVRGKDGWNKYKPTNLNTDEVELNDNEVVLEEEEEGEVEEVEDTKIEKGSLASKLKASERKNHQNDSSENLVSK